MTKDEWFYATVYNLVDRHNVFESVEEARTEFDQWLANIRGVSYSLGYHDGFEDAEEGYAAGLEDGTYDACDGF